MTRTLIAVLACLLLVAARRGPPTPPAPLPYLQSWSDPGLIAVDDDWSVAGDRRPPGRRAHRSAGRRPAQRHGRRLVHARRRGCQPNRSDRDRPRRRGRGVRAGGPGGGAPGLGHGGGPSPAAVARHARPAGRGRAAHAARRRRVLELRRRATRGAAVPHGRRRGAFASLPGGYVADATSGPGQATLVTPVQAKLPEEADDQPLVQVRVIITNAIGQDEWVGIDDIEVAAASAAGGGTGTVPRTEPPCRRRRARACPGPAPGPSPWSRTGRRSRHRSSRDLELTPPTFTPARRGPAIVRRGRAGTGAAIPALTRGAGAVRGGAERRARPGDLAQRPWRGRLVPTGARGARVRAAGRPAAGAYRRGQAAFASGGRFSASRGPGAGSTGFGSAAGCGAGRWRPARTC